MERASGPSVFMQLMGLSFLHEHLRRRYSRRFLPPEVVNTENEMTLGAGVRKSVAGVELCVASNAGNDHFDINPQESFRLLPGA